MAQRARPGLVEDLTQREREVLELLRLGMTNGEIARRLQISPDGAKYHVSEIIGKLGVRNRYEASAWPERPSWWLGAVAPAGLLWRQVRTSWFGALAAAGVGIAVAAGIALLVWGLLRTNGDEGAKSCAGQPLAAADETALAYAAADGTIWTMASDGSHKQQVICQVTRSQNASWSPSGRYLAHAASDGTLQLLDLETGANTVLGGDAEDSVAFGSDPFGSEVRWSPEDDALAYVTYGGDRRQLATGLWVVSPGSPAKALAQMSGILRFAWSLDGQRLVFEVHTQTESGTAERTDELYVTNADGTGVHKLTNGILLNTVPWSPDGRLLAYWKSDHGGSAMVGEIYVMDMQNETEFSLGEFNSDQHPQWSPDPSRPVFFNMAIDAEAQTAIALFDAPTVILGWSPDGSRVVYIENEGSRPPARNLVIRDVATDDRLDIPIGAPTAHAGEPGAYGTWSPDSRYFAYVALGPNRENDTVPIFGVVDTRSGNPQSVLVNPDTYGGILPSYSPDGSRLTIQAGTDTSPLIWVAEPDGSDVKPIGEGVLLNYMGWRPGTR